MNKDTLFQATLMPDKDWWQALWPDPEGVLRKLGIKADMQVVDLCCGDGHFTRPLCDLVHPGKAWALDLDVDLLAQAEKGCEDNTNFHAIHGDARELPKQLPEPVDYVFIANTFHGVPDKTELSQKVYEVLKPGGQFAVINWHKRPREETTVLGMPRGPDTELRMTPQDVQHYVEPAGFALDKTVEVGPYHYAAIFTKTRRKQA